MNDKTSRRKFIKAAALSGIALSFSEKIEALAAARKKPNIILILADDLGYSDLSCNGQKHFQTPNIDQLAKEGMSFTQHYSGSPVCAPSRCSLLTGLHTGHSYIRDNDEMAERGDVWSDFVKYEGQRPIPENTNTIGKVLQSAGYKTACVGKWGLGGPETAGVPNKQGFDFFYGYLCQRMAHTHYPPYLWRNDKKEYLTENKFFVTHEKFPADKDPNNSSNYERYKGKQYAFDLMLDETINFIKENKSKPFFLYFTPTIPHVSLQVPDDEMKQFENKFEETPYLGNKGYLPHQKPRAAYAAMMSRLDKGIGKINALLKELKIDDDTLVIFTSDNGATFDIGGFDPKFFRSNGDLNGAKASVYEGGIRIPFIAKWKGKIRSGTTTNHISAFWDLMPTLCDAAGAKKPNETDGISFLNELQEKKQKQKKHKYLYWEHARKQQAVRMGDWKAVKKNFNVPLELYNLKDDPNEKTNVAALFPQVVENISSLMKTARVESELFPLITK